MKPPKIQIIQTLFKTIIISQKNIMKYKEHIIYIYNNLQLFKCLHHPYLLQVQSIALSSATECPVLAFLNNLPNVV